MMIDLGIFRAYDIRGIVGQSLNCETVYALGQAIGSEVLAMGEASLAVARDGRLSGPELLKSLCNGIISTGCHVLDIGMVPTPVLYFSTFILETSSGVMLTGSHNPPEYNGLKIVIHGKTLAEEKIKALYQRILTQDFVTGKGSISTVEVVPHYFDRILQDIHLARPLKIVVDCGNGVAGKIAPLLFKQMGCEVYELFCEVDGLFPNHHPDPSQPKNLKDLIQKVQAVKADIGVAFDGDGDRLGVVTSRGEIIWPDRQLMLFAQAILQKNPGANIIYDVKCTNQLASVIEKAGGQPIMWKTGHSLIKSKLIETGALLAGEMSGHLFFKERWYGFDDAIYAAARLFEILSHTSQTSDEIFKALPNSVNTPELKIDIAEQEKFSFMEKLIQHAKFDLAEVITLDGLRVNFSDGWGLIRPSNTTPCLVLRFEAKNQTILQQIQTIFRANILTVNPNLVLPF